MVWFRWRAEERGVRGSWNRTAYPIHQLIYILFVETMIDELDESVSLEAFQKISAELLLLLSIALGVLQYIQHW